MFQFIFFVLTLEFTVYGNAKAVNPKYDYSKLISYSENINGKPFQDNYKPFELEKRHEAIVPYDNVPEAIDARRIFGFFKNIFTGQKTTITSSTTTTTANPNPVNKDLFESFTTTPETTVLVSENVIDSDYKLRDHRNESTELKLEPLNIMPNKTDKRESLKDEEMKEILKRLTNVLSALDNKLQEIILNNHSNEEENTLLSKTISIVNNDVKFRTQLLKKTPKNQDNKVGNYIPLPNIILNEYGDIVLDDVIKSYRIRNKRQVDNNGNIPVAVMSIEKTTSGDKLISTTTNPVAISVIGKIEKQEMPNLVHVNTKKENELHKSDNENTTNRVQYLNISEIITKLQKRNSKYIGKNTSVSLNVTDGIVNNSKIFKIRVKRKINETGLNVLNREIPEKSINIPNSVAESIITKVKANNVTKNEILIKSLIRDDHIQVTQKLSCNESQPIPNGRRSYNSEETPSEVKQKLLKYMEETFAEIFEKIQPLEDIKRSFGTQNMYRVGYIAANLDTLEVNLRNLKTELESNKDLWSDNKIMDIFDKVMSTNKIVSSLLTALQAFSLHDVTSSAQPFVSYSQKYQMQPGLY